MLAEVLLLFCVTSICFYAYSIYAACQFFNGSTANHSSQSDRPLPPITILKPICGLDSNADVNLASFFSLDYPVYQVLFGVRDAHDPAIPLIQKLIQAFPACDARLVIDDRVIGSNLKVSNLANLDAFAKHDLLLISDSDIHVTPDYLRRIVQPMADPAIGVVTCLYRSQARTWMAKFEALAIATDFHAGVLTAHRLGWMKFAMGSSILIRRSALTAIGGLSAIADYLADDFMLGHLPTRKGYRTVLSDYIVDHILDTATPLDFVQHQTRWNRCTRSANPGGYWGLIFTQGVTFSTLFCLLEQGSWLGWGMLGTVWSIRLLMAWVIGVYYLKDPIAQRSWMAVPFRDWVSSALWVYGLMGRHVIWRGQKFRLKADGKLVPLLANSSRSTLSQPLPE
jgi:ceramide glucosyltransferase